MTLPNKLTLSRFILTPIFALFFYFLCSGLSDVCSKVSAVVVVLLYGSMEVTDLLDGKIARKRHLVTDLGKVFDPFADCFMHVTFFALFVYFRFIDLLPFMFIIWREFSINFVRMLLMKTNVALAANMFGKFKTVFYAALSFLIIVFTSVSAFVSFSSDLIESTLKLFRFLSYIAAFFSVLSFAVYMRDIVRNHTLDSISR